MEMRRQSSKTETPRRIADLESWRGKREEAARKSAELGPGVEEEDSKLDPGDEEEMRDTTRKRKLKAEKSETSIECHKNRRYRVSKIIETGQVMFITGCA